VGATGAIVNLCSTALSVSPRVKPVVNAVVADSYRNTRAITEEAQAWMQA
jgi:hypothetical protein